MKHWTRLTGNSKTLAATQILRLPFGIYLAIKDWLVYDDPDSALTVLAIYVILGFFTVMFFYGKRFGLHGIVGLSVVFVIFNTIFTVMALISTL